MDDRERCPNGQYRKIWTYREAVKAIPKLKPLLLNAKERHIRVLMLERRANAATDLAERWKLYNEHSRQDAEAVKVYDQVIATGVIVFHILQGLFLFPIRNPDATNETVLLLYRDSMDEPDTWLTAEEANHDLKSHPSRLVAGTVHRIPSHWTKT